jgi:glutathione synthase
MVQPFLPEISEGDKRIVWSMARLPARSTAARARASSAPTSPGGSAEATTLTAREEEICAAMGPELKARGLVFVGIDVIGGKWLTEINVTSPTGIVRD